MRVMKTITCLLLLAVLVGISGCCLFQPIAIKLRHPMTVALRIENTNGVAQAGVHLRFTESGWRYLVPIPFTWQWMVTGPSHEVTSDAAGAATVAFHDDYLNLRGISVGGLMVTNFTTIFYRFDGHCFTNQNHGYYWTLQYGCYPKAKEPLHEDYTIKIR